MSERRTALDSDGDEIPPLVNPPLMVASATSTSPLAAKEEIRTMSSGDVFAELALSLIRPGLEPDVARIIESVLRRHREFFESNQTVSVRVNLL